MKRVMNFAKNLTSELKVNNISQEKFARELQTTQATISRWCAGVNEPDYETLFEICKILKTSPNVLLGWED